MTTITEETVRALAGFRSTDAPVTTCYLDVDGRHLPTHREVQQSFGSLVRHAGLNGHAHPSVVQDVQRMERHVRGFKRARARGLAMFSCSAEGFWEVHELPMSVTSRLLVHDTPCVRQLEDVMERSARLGVLLTDRQRARMFVYELAEAVEHSEAVDPLVRDGSDGRGDLVKTRVGNQRQEQTLQHVRRAAQHAFAVYQDTGFARLVIGAPTPDVLAELEQALHPYLRDRVVSRLSVPIGVGRERLGRMVQDAEAAIERREEAALVSRLRDAAGTTGGVTGLAGTLRAVCDRRVERLFVSRGYVAEGWRCPACGCLATVGRRCPACGGDMVHVDDVIEDTVQEALIQHCRVSILVDNADLDVLGCIGALLRY